MKYAPKLPLQSTKVASNHPFVVKAIDVFGYDFADESWTAPFPNTKFVLKNTRKYVVDQILYLPKDRVLVSPSFFGDNVWIVPNTMSFDELVQLMKKNGYFVK